MDKQKYKITSDLPTKLTEGDLVNVKRLAFDYLKTHEFVTNRILREMAGVTYDQAIFFFGQMLKRKVLHKVGTASGTRYVIKPQRATGSK